MSQPQDSPRDEDAAWRDIVEQYGERARLSDDDLAATPTPDPEPAPAPAFDWRPEQEDRFVPPDPGPVVLPTGPRGLAWGGIVFAPAILLLCLVLNYRLPFPLGYVLVAWFLGGFGYLVWTMPRERPDPWDDGSRV